MSDDTAQNFDPFSAQEAPGVSLIVLMRIYDVLMAMYTEMDADKAEEMLRLHQQGALLATTPAFSGRFLTDEEPPDEPKVD